MNWHWLLAIAIIGILTFQANGDDLLEVSIDANSFQASNHKEMDVECGDPYTDAGATAWDDYEGDITSAIKVGGDVVASDLVGEYNITYNVSDSAGNAAPESTRTVRIIDTLPPIITIFGNNPATVALGEAYTDSGANAYDACEGDLTGRMLVNNMVDAYAVGQYAVTYNVEDVSGNVAEEAIRVVHVVDDMPDVGSLSDIVLEEGMFYEWDANIENEAAVNVFQWYRHNGRHFEPVIDGTFSQGAFSGAETSVLHFAPFTTAMAGEYLLEVSNDKTTVQRTATVTSEKDTGLPVASVFGLAAIALATAVTGATALKKNQR